MKEKFLISHFLVILFSIAILNACVPTGSKIKPIVVTGTAVQPTNTQTSSFITKCIDIDFNWRDKLNAKDILILHQYFPVGDTTAIDFNTNQEHILNNKNEFFVNPAISPDGKWLFFADAYDNSDQINLSILPFSFSAKKEVSVLRAEWSTLGFYWQNNQGVLINMLSDETWGPNHFVMINPFDGKYIELPNTFPSIAPNDAWQWEVSGRTLYNNDLSFVIYPTVSEKYPGPGYVIWDTKAHEEKAFIAGNIYNSPKWSDDGTKVAVALPKYGIYQEELFVMDTNGEMNQATNLNGKYANIDIGNLSWSPDGKHIAFWVLTNQKDNTISHLFLLSSDTNEVIDYCIPDKQNIFASGNLNYESLPSPKWSLDSRYVSFASLSKNGNIQTVVVDIIEDKAFQVAENMQPVGWMSKEP